MKNRYSIIDEFGIKDSKVIILDKNIDFSDYKTAHIQVGDKTYSCALTHNENWLVVTTQERLTGQTFEFV